MGIFSGQKRPNFQRISSEDRFPYKICGVHCEQNSLTLTDSKVMVIICSKSNLKKLSYNANEKYRN